MFYCIAPFFLGKFFIGLCSFAFRWTFRLFGRYHWGCSEVASPEGVTMDLEDFLSNLMILGVLFSRKVIVCIYQGMSKNIVNNFKQKSIRAWADLPLARFGHHGKNIADISTWDLPRKFPLNVPGERLLIWKHVNIDSKIKSKEINKTSSSLHERDFLFSIMKNVEGVIAAACLLCFLKPIICT